MEMVKLKDKVRDVFSGFEGIVVVKSYYISGIVRCGVQGKVDKDNKVPEVYWVDEVHLQLIEE